MVSLKCLRCKVLLEGDSEGPDCPLGGISLRATGNYGSTVWDPVGDDLMFTAWLCDYCFNFLRHSKEYLVFERIEARHDRKEVTMEEAMGGYTPKVTKLNEWQDPTDEQEVLEDLVLLDALASVFDEMPVPEGIEHSEDDIRMFTLEGMPPFVTDKEALEVLELLKALDFTGEDDWAYKPGC